MLDTGIDMLVAEKVMGWHSQQTLNGRMWFDEKGARRPLPRFTDDITAAMDVLCKARGLGRGEGGPLRQFMIAASHSHKGGYKCDFYVSPGDWLGGWGETISEAICDAALKLAGYLPTERASSGEG